MTSFTFRPQTMDFNIFNMVYFHNEYQLPPRFSPDDIIIDIGAHIGSFTFAALVRGVRHVMAIEAHPENYLLAQAHLADYIAAGKVNLRHGAVWRSDDNNDKLYHSDFPMLANNLSNTGNVNVQPIGEGHQLSKLPLDDLIQLATNQHTKRIRLLKIDCEGSEFPILLTSKCLHLIDEIVGEFHEFGGDYDKQHPNIALPHFERFTVDRLLSHLQQHGFRTESRRHQRYEEGTWIPQRLGFFRAVRYNHLK